MQKKTISYSDKCLSLWCTWSSITWNGAKSLYLKIDGRFDKDLHLGASKQLLGSCLCLHRVHFRYCPIVNAHKQPLAKGCKFFGYNLVFSSSISPYTSAPLRSPNLYIIPPSSTLQYPILYSEIPKETSENGSKEVHPCCSVAGFSSRNLWEFWVPRGGFGLGGEAVGPLWALEEPPHGVPGPRWEAEAIQRVQAECDAYPQGQQTGPGLQVEAEQVCPHDQSWVPEHVCRLQGRSPQNVPWIPPRIGQVYAWECHSSANLSRLESQGRSHWRQGPRPMR